MFCDGEPFSVARNMLDQGSHGDINRVCGTNEWLWRNTAYYATFAICVLFYDHIHFVCVIKKDMKKLSVILVWIFLLHRRSDRIDFRTAAVVLQWKVGKAFILAAGDCQQWSGPVYTAICAHFSAHMAIHTKVASISTTDRSAKESERCRLHRHVYIFGPPDNSREVLYFTAELLCHPSSYLSDGQSASHQKHVSGWAHRSGTYWLKHFAHLITLLRVLSGKPTTASEGSREIA